jgi:hypothetical protein
MDQPMETLSIHTDRLLQNHQYQQQSNDCGPLCAAMVINTLKGLKVDGFSLAASMNDPRNNPGVGLFPRIPDSATFPWGIISVFAGYGIKANWSSFTPFARLAELLKAGSMLIVITATYQPVTAHYRILASVASDHLGFVDPAYPQEVIQYQPMDAFVSNWHRALDTIINIPNQ